MGIRNTVISILLCLGVVVLLPNCYSTKKSIRNDEVLKKQSLLVLYGKEIYRREECANCHTFDITKQNAEIISLDGIGKKFLANDIFLFNYFSNPRILNQDSEKEENYHLFRTPYDQDLMIKISKENNLKIENEDLREEIINQSHELKSSLKEANEEVYDTEIIALIAYLDQILPTKERIKIDSIENLKFEALTNNWKLVQKNDYKSIIEIANNPINIRMGEQIFTKYCSPCHGKKGEGIVGPNLCDEYWLHGGEIVEIIRTIQNGVAQRGMISWKSQIQPEEVGMIVSYIKSLEGNCPENAKEPQGNKKG